MDGGIAVIFLERISMENGIDFRFMEKAGKYFSRLVVIGCHGIEAEVRIRLEQITKEIIIDENAGKLSGWKEIAMDYLNEADRRGCARLALISMDAYYMDFGMDCILDDICREGAELGGVGYYGIQEDYPLLIFSNRLIRDYSFRQFWEDQPEGKDRDAFAFFRDRGFRCHFADDGGTGVILKKESLQNLDAGKFGREEKRKILKILEKASWQDRDEILVDMIKSNCPIILDFFFGPYVGVGADNRQSMEADRAKAEAGGFDYEIVIIVERYENVEKAKKWIGSDAGSRRISLCVKREIADETLTEDGSVRLYLYDGPDFFQSVCGMLGQIEQRRALFLMDDFFSGFLECPSSGSGFGDICRRLAQGMEGNKYAAASRLRLPVSQHSYMDRNRKRMELRDLYGEMGELPETECALLCRNDVLQKVRDSVHDIRFLPAYFREAGYLTVSVGDLKELAERALWADGICSRLIGIGMDYGKLKCTDLEGFMEQSIRLFEEYHILKKKLSAAQAEADKWKERNKRLSEGESGPVIREIPILVDIGVRGAIGNWFRKRFRRMA